MYGCEECDHFFVDVSTYYNHMRRRHGLDSAEAKKKAKLVEPNGCEHSDFDIFFQLFIIHSIGKTTSLQLPSHMYVNNVEKISVSEAHYKPIQLYI